MMDSINKNIHGYDKGQLRRLALSKRNELDEDFRKKAGDSIAASLLRHAAVEAAGTIMCYCDFRSEVPTRELVRQLEAKGKKMCFPVCEKGGIMHAWHPVNKESWKTGMMGICEPDTAKSELVEPEDIDLVICPMVAFDLKCCRMGYGGGYYDRYLPRCKKAVRIGIAFEAQHTEGLVTDSYDCPMDFVITEEKIYKKETVSL